MAITPRTIFSEPSHLLQLAMALLTVGALVGVGYFTHEVYQVDEPVQPSNASSETAIIIMATRADTPRRTRCDLVKPEAGWSSAQWVRHLNCMEMRHASTEALLQEVDQGIEAVGLKPNLAVKKSDYLKNFATLDAQIDFLQIAVDGLGVVDARLLHRLRRALIWRGHPDDLEQIRTLKGLSTMFIPGREVAHCELQQTDIWAQMMATRAADAANAFRPAARPLEHPRVQHLVHNYVATNCLDQLNHGQWDELAQLVGVAIAAEATNGHSGHSSIIREIAKSYRVLQIPQFCRAAVPAGLELRQACEKRVGDEQFLAR